MKKAFILLTVILFLIILPAIMISRRTSVSGDFSEISAKIEVLRQENRRLEKEIVQKTSSAVIYQKALSEGYGDITLSKPVVDQVALSR